MKAILLSIRPKWIEKILNGDKTIEVRLRFPDYKGWVYIYCTQDEGLVWDNEGKGLVNKKLFPYAKGCPENHRLINGKVVARFYCDKVEEIKPSENFGFDTKDGVKDYYYCQNDTLEDIGTLHKNSCLCGEDMFNYLKGKSGYAIHISQLEIFDKPKIIENFYKLGKGKCAECPYNHEDMLGEECFKECLITKAPQSWMFIEAE